ncbi:MAG: Rpn family recombination-promoting nuclease/putative transposase [Mediterranea sp.]|jgi:predicted transposase/invertase (TIGR01784 family)|nr:Rpn family recombination-promoting nuclease/putative transposase [Mediterranea sp.]
MSKFINPFTDWGFKRLFGQEESKGILIGFLNTLLEGEKVIKDVTFQNNEQTAPVKGERTIVYDVYCQTASGEEFIVEMQNQAQDTFKERALYYVSNAIARQGKEGGEWGYRVRAVYGVFFVNFSMRGSEKLRTDVVLADRDTGQLFSDKLRQVFISLPYFDKTEAECETDFERWIYVLTNMDKLDKIPFKTDLDVMKELERIASLRSLTPQEMWDYDCALNSYRSNEGAWRAMERKVVEAEANAKRRIREARAKAKEAEAKAEAKAKEAKAEAEAKAKEAKAEKEDMVRELKRLNMPIATIAQVTKLSEEEIEAL